MKSFILGAIPAFFLIYCAPPDMQVQLPTGIWRATLSFQEIQLPFNFVLAKDSSAGYQVTILNAEEELLLDEINLQGDSVIMPLHIFDASIKGVFRNDSIIGIFVKHYDPANTIPFTAVYGQGFRFKKEPDNVVTKNFTGKYRVVFQSESDTTIAVGIFNQKADSVTGTFLTTSGDYRYLQGNVVNDTMLISGFDGNHAYLFTSVFVGDDELKGYFYPNRTKKTLWKAWRDDTAALPNPDSLTTLNTGYEKIEFSFPDADGKVISLADEKFKNKVVILQLFGTWCPNCMDETRFLIPWYQKNAHRGVEIIGLAFERKDDFTYASTRVKRMISKMKVPYDLVIAGTNDKEKAALKLPMLNKIASFPTTIFIGRDGKVRKIHTGFSGPGTGKYYEEYIREFNETVNSLLNENVTSSHEISKLNE